MGIISANPVGVLPVVHIADGVMTKLSFIWSLRKTAGIVYNNILNIIYDNNASFFFEVNNK